MNALSLLALLGCGQPAPPDVFLLTIDTLRADRVGALGSKRDTTPWIDEVAAQGAVFEQAYSTSSWTAPGAAATLFSAYPWQLGIHESTKVGSPTPVLPAEATSLATVFREHGYRTIGYVANSHLSAERGYDRGFDVFENVGFSDRDKVRAAIQRRTPRLRDRERPVFVWIHLFDPHEPYASGLSFAESYSPGIDTRLGTPRMDRMLMTQLRADPRFAAGLPGVSELMALYDGEVRATDDALRGLAQDLGIDEGDILVIAADHGEEFREHGRLGHHGPLWQQTTHIPLIVRAPGLAPARRSEVVSLVDVPATVAAAAGIPAPGSWVGQDLRGAVSGPRFMELDRKQAVLADGHKWMRETGVSSVQPKLFTLDDDHRDLFATDPVRASAMQRLWESRDFPIWDPQPGTISEERELLEAMGYLEPTASPR